MKTNITPQTKMEKLIKRYRSMPNKANRQKIKDLLINCPASINGFETFLTANEII